MSLPNHLKDMKQRDFNWNFIKYLNFSVTWDFPVPELDVLHQHQL